MGEKNVAVDRSLGGAGKGDTPRPLKKSKYDEVFTKAFGDRDPLDFQKCQKIKIIISK